MIRLLFALMLGAAAGALAAAEPTLFIVGDSTAAPDSGDIRGWGVPFAQFFDPAAVRVVNRARGGRSSRTYFTEGSWGKVVADLHPGDLVLIQMGMNDGGAVNDASRARGSLPGLGEEQQEIDNLVTKQHETVHTFGWYLRRYIADAQGKGAAVIILSPTVRNIWTNGSVERGPGHYREWSKEVAAAAHVPFLDATELIAERYERMGPAAVGKLFPHDHTHTSPEGAEMVAGVIAKGLEPVLRSQGLAQFAPRFTGR